MVWMNAGGSLMWVLLLLSIIALAIVLERVVFYIRASTDPIELEKEFGKAIASGSIERASQLVNAKGSSLHRVFNAAFTHWRVSREDMKLLLEQSVRREIYRWEKYLPLLDVIGKLAPLIGLLGTVLGMVEMFHALTVNAQVSSAIVTGGIWKALYTTVMGLCVAIPVIFAHQILNNWVDKEEEALERGVDYLIREHFCFLSGENCGEHR